MFVVSKILGVLTQPLTWVAALLLASLTLTPRQPKLSRRLTGLALAILLLLGWLPLPDELLRQLEQQYAEFSPEAPLGDYVGIIVLGGAQESGQVAQDHVQPLLIDSAERMTTPLALLRHQPQLRVVFTGGEGALLGAGPSEAVRAKVFFDSMGLGLDRIQYESASRTTYENAVFSARLPGVDTTQRWLLVTSAWHMPRSMATFTKAGWNVTAYPVDFRTGKQTPWTDYSIGKGANRWQLVLHEGLGLLAYRATGKL